jgi:hypothetical protein
MGADVTIHRINKNVDINTQNMHRCYTWVSDNVDMCDEDYYIIKITGNTKNGEIILPRATTNLIVIG